MNRRGFFAALLAPLFARLRRRTTTLGAAIPTEENTTIQVRAIDPMDRAPCYVILTEEITMKQLLERYPS